VLACLLRTQDPCQWQTQKSPESLVGSSGLVWLELLHPHAVGPRRVLAALPPSGLVWAHSGLIGRAQASEHQVLGRLDEDPLPLRRGWVAHRMTPHALIETRTRETVGISSAIMPRGYAITVPRSQRPSGLLEV